MSENTIPLNDQPDINQELELAVAAFNSGDEVGAAAWLERLAEQGSAPAMTWAGYVYLHGKGVAAEEALALRWFLKAAEAGDAYGQHSLSYMLDKDGEPEEAERWLRKAAEQGYEPALRSVREKRAYGMFKEKLYGEALPIFREAAGVGSAWSHEMLGYLYWRGYGVEVDRDRAVQHYEAAYDGGRSSVSSAIGRLHLSSGRPETALEWLRKDNPRPISSLYWQYRVLKEHPHLERYCGESGDVLRRAADAGHIFAKRDLTLRMLSGREGLRMRFRGACEWLGLLPRFVRMNLKDANDERLK